MGEKVSDVVLENVGENDNDLSGTSLSSKYSSEYVQFGDNVNYSSSSTVGTFLNGEYLTSYVGNLYTDVIEESTTWYLGEVGAGTSYKLAKYTDTSMTNLINYTTNAKIGLLRLGELMAGQFDGYDKMQIIGI